MEIAFTLQLLLLEHNIVIKSMLDNMMIKWPNSIIKNRLGKILILVFSIRKEESNFKIIESHLNKNHFIVVSILTKNLILFKYKVFIEHQDIKLLFNFIKVTTKKLQQKSYKQTSQQGVRMEISANGQGGKNGKNLRFFDVCHVLN